MGREGREGAAETRSPPFLAESASGLRHYVRFGIYSATLAGLLEDRDVMTINQLREAVARAVDATSLRKVAKEVGVSPTGLKGFLLGRGLYGPSRRRLTAWYMVKEESGEVPAAPSLDDASASVTLLLREIEDELGPERAAALRADMSRCLGSGWEGMPGAEAAVEGVKVRYRGRHPVRRKPGFRPAPPAGAPAPNSVVFLLLDPRRGGPLLVDPTRLLS